MSYRVQFGDPAFGQVFPCRKCAKRTDYTFDKFMPRAGTEEAVKACLAFVRGKGKPWLVLYGEVGRGKTHLARAVCDELFWTQPMVSVKMGFVPDILAHIRTAYGEKNSNVAEQWMGLWRTCDVAVLDDIGAHKVTDWATETLLRMLNARYEGKKRTMFTCNLRLEQLQASLGDRLLSRLRDVNLCDEVFMTCSDFRNVREARSL